MGCLSFSFVSLSLDLLSASFCLSLFRCLFLVPPLSLLVLLLICSCLSFLIIRTQHDSIHHITSFLSLRSLRLFLLSSLSVSLSCSFSFLFSPHDLVLSLLQTQPVTLHYHYYGITSSSVTSHPFLSSFIRILSTNVDAEGNELVSLFEGTNVPIYGSQFHPVCNSISVFVFLWSFVSCSSPFLSIFCHIILIFFSYRPRRDWKELSAHLWIAIPSCLCFYFCFYPSLFLFLALLLNVLLYTNPLCFLDLVHSFCFVLFCFVLFCFVLFCCSLFYFFSIVLTLSFPSLSPLSPLLFALPVGFVLSCQCLSLFSLSVSFWFCVSFFSVWPFLSQEMPLFEWDDGPLLGEEGHAADTIFVNRYFADFFVAQARRCPHVCDLGMGKSVTQQTQQETRIRCRADRELTQHICSLSLERCLVSILLFAFFVCLFPPFLDHYAWPALFLFLFFFVRLSAPVVFSWIRLFVCLFVCLFLFVSWSLCSDHFIYNYNPTYAMKLGIDTFEQIYFFN